MSEVQLVTRKVCLDPEFLDCNIKKHIQDRLKLTLNNECTKEHGYFLNVIKIKKILDNYISTDCRVHDDHRISSNCQNIFIVLFEAETIKPEKDKVLEGIATTILSAGISVTIQNKLKVLIPAPIETLEFDFTTKSYKSDVLTIKQGDKIKVKILNTKYSDKSFKCYGAFVSE